MNILCQAIRIVLDGGRTNHAAKEVIRHQRNLEQVSTCTFRSLMEVYFKTSKDSTAVKWAALKQLKKTESFGADLKQLDQMMKKTVSDKRKIAAAMKKEVSLKDEIRFFKSRIRRVEQAISSPLVAGVVKTLLEATLAGDRLQVQRLTKARAAEKLKLKELRTANDKNQWDISMQNIRNPEQVPWRSLYVLQSVQNSSALARVFKESGRLKLTLDEMKKAFQ